MLQFTKIGVNHIRSREASGFGVLRNALKHTKSTSSVINDNPVTWVLRGLKYGCGTLLAAHLFFTYGLVQEFTYGVSMIPTIDMSGQWVIVSKYYRRGRGIKVGDIISFTHPMDCNAKASKRVIGMPGDFVLMDSPTSVTIRKQNSAMIQVPEGHCYVIGDNLDFSRDSRVYGPIPMALINGKVILRGNTGSLRGMIRIKNPIDQESEELSCS